MRSDAQSESRPVSKTTPVVPAQPAAMTEDKKQDRVTVTCPACNGTGRELRRTSEPGNRLRDVGWCYRCNGYRNVAVRSLTKREREERAA